MTELEFARQHLGDFKQRGDEIVAKYCPLCHGGSKQDKWTFSLNVKKHVYKCFRGSCNASGHFNELLKELGLPVERTLLPNEDKYQVHTPKVAHKYKQPPKLAIKKDGPEMEYIYGRGITLETCKAFGVGGCNGEIVFPYYKNADDFLREQPTFVKYRPAHKLKDGEKKARREKDTMPVLYGMHNCTPQKGTLYIFEGEFDAMVGYQVHGGNCVSVPSGCTDFTWIDTCADFLMQYATVAVIGDNDDPGHEMVERIADKLECLVLAPDWDLYGTCKDVNELLFRSGAGRVQEVIESVRPVPTLGLLNIAQVRAADLTSLPRLISGIAPIDRLTGGLYMGDLIILTGRRGEGKSTFLSQLTLEAVDQELNVCVYSGEITAERYRYLLYLQAAGADHILDYEDSRAGRTVQYVQRTDMQRIDQWLDGRYWLYDNRIDKADAPESILSVFEKAYRRYDCRVFIVDNLMTVQNGCSDSDYYHKQADFVLKLQKFARTHQVLVCLAAHPRKTGPKGITDNDEVAGLGTITNIADTVFAIRRVTDEDREDHHLDDAVDTIIAIYKNRATGELGKIGLSYLPRSRRLILVDDQEKSFAWSKETVIDPQHLEDPPF